MESLRVADVMVTSVITVGPDAPLESVARALVEHRIHRLPVVEEGRLVGLVSSTDLVRLVAEGRLRAG
jgi:tRNA nucleotidyltransferase (CCA-adding enzyme)